MADDLKISELPDYSALIGDDLFAIVDSNELVTKKIKWLELLNTLALSNYLYLPGRVGGQIVDDDVQFNSIGINTPPSSTYKFDLAGCVNFITVDRPTVPLTATLAGVPGDLDNGTYRYRVSYYTAIGETMLSSGIVSITVTDKTTNGQVNLTNIAVSANSDVVGRRIYRTKVGSTSGYYLLTDIADNTTTTFTDNTADSTFAAITYDNRDNTTSNKIFSKGIFTGFYGDYNTFLGRRSGGDGYNISGYYNFGLGNYSLYSLRDGAQITAVGAFSAFKLVSGTSIVTMGFNSFYNLLTGAGTVGIGTNVMYLATSAPNVVAVGASAGYTPAGLVANACTTTDKAVFIGPYTGLASPTQRTNVAAIGYYATVDADNTMALGGVGANALSVAIGRTTANSRLDVNGSLALPYVAKTANYTLGLQDYTVDCTANSFTITLPTAVGITGRIYNIKNTGTGTITVDADGTETIDGDLTESVYQYENLQIQSTGAGWIIL